MDKVSNGLNNAQLERIAILVEECNEVGQVIGKIIRHGYESSSPIPHDLGQDSNKVLLQKEICDVLLMITFMVQRGDLSEVFDGSDEYVKEKIDRLNKYFHHNEITKDDITNILGYEL